MLQKDGDDKKTSFRKRDFCMVYADKVRIVQVIINILENAIEFTKVGKIYLNLSQNLDSNETFLSISDSGSGIDSEVLPNIFSKFVSKSKKGTGLGLYISKKIIEAHGGKIWAENCFNTSNKITGSKFTFSLPSRK